MLQLSFHKCWTLYHGMLKLNDVERKQEWAPFRSTRMTMGARTSTKMSLRSIKLYCVYFASNSFSKVGQFSWSLIVTDSIQSSLERETNIHFPHNTSHQEVSRLKVRSHGWPEEFWLVENLCVSVSLPNTTLTVRTFRRLAAPKQNEVKFSAGTIESPFDSFIAFIRYSQTCTKRLFDLVRYLSCRNSM